MRIAIALLLTTALQAWTPTYVLALQITNTYNTNSPAVFQIPVTKEYYDSVKIGSQIKNGPKFKVCLGNWKVKVINKAIY